MIADLAFSHSGKSNSFDNNRTDICLNGFILHSHWYFWNTADIEPLEDNMKTWFLPVSIFPVENNYTYFSSIEIFFFLYTQDEDS